MLFYIDFLYKKINNSVPVSELSMQNNAELIMFYCTSFMNNQVYYLKELDAVVITDYQDKVLFLNDIFCEKEIPFSDLFSSIINTEIKKIDN